MAKKTLDSVGPVASMPTANSSAGEEISCCVRPIDNGFIVRTTRVSDGEYKCTERYSPTAPDMNAALGMKETSPGRGMMRDAVKELNK